jgi:hypothetical protein
MAIVVIGGLILSTLLTLLVIPVMYTCFDDLAALLRRAGRAATGPTPPADGSASMAPGTLEPETGARHERGT